MPDGHINPNFGDGGGQVDSYETFFTDTGNGKYVPRSIFVDLDPSVRNVRPEVITDSG